MTKNDWLALWARCNITKGPVKEIDSAIACAVFGWHEEYVDLDPYGQVPMFVDSNGNGPCIPDRYTESLDSIVALVENQFPLAAWRVMKPLNSVYGGEPGRPQATIQRRAEQFFDIWTDTEGDTPARALCAAFCRAMAEKIRTGDVGDDFK